jgi:DNA-binding IclR family transcriptional regulator|tara:strand:- start:430 stop:1275 length:846 start_codon:yes stop_codon:yes gene_type:complete
MISGCLFRLLIKNLIRRWDIEDMVEKTKPLKDEHELQAPRSQTLVRGFQIIDAVAERPRNIQEISSVTGLTYGTVHRIVAVLQEQRYLKPERSHGFTLGPRLIELGFAAYSRVDLVQVVRPWLEELSDLTHDTVHLARREGWEVTYLDKLPGARPVEISSRVGGRKPVISTGVGKALLFDEPELVLKQLYEQDGHLLPDRMSQKEWLALMASYRAEGYSYDLGEDEPSIRCVAAPLRDATGKIIAAVSVSSTHEYMSPARMQELIPLVKRIAKSISHELGA